MSQQQYAPMMMPRETNGLGVAGFVCSMLGFFFTGGLLCPIGLILSLIALGKQPRGFAIAGLIVGLLGTCGWAAVFIFAGAALLAALGLAVVAISLSEPEKLEITSDMINMTVAIKAYEEENRYLPADLETLTLKTSTLMDPWGQRYQYHLTDERPGFDIVSAGADGQFGTEDDVRLTTLGEAWNPDGLGIRVSELDDGSRVRISVGGRSLTAEGSDDGGTVTIDLGDRVIEFVGDEEGGEINVESTGGATSAPDAPPADEESEAPSDDAVDDSSS
jgi:hypothetical protein